MIEFSGYISGAAEKRFFNRSINLVQNIFLFAVLVFLPTMIRLSIKTESWVLIAGYCSLFAVVPLLVRIPKSKKEKLAMTPKKIYVEEEHIICVTEQYVESRLINDVKKVINNPEFYELVFPFGKVSDKFICQKCLLTKGSLEDFESLFQGKIIKK